MKLQMSLLLVQLLSISNAYKILLIFPFPTKSHSILGDGFVRHLLRAGHHVTYVTTSPWTKPHTNLRQLNVSENYNYMSESFLNIEVLMKKELMLHHEEVFELCRAVTINTLKHIEVQDLMNNSKEKFDLVIAEWMFSELFAGLGSVFDSPLVWSSSLDSHWIVRRFMDEATNPAYTADYASTNQPPFNFLQRIEELWTQIRMSTVMKFSLEPQAEMDFKEIFEPVLARRGKILPEYSDSVGNASLMLLNAHVSFGQPNSIPQNFKYIGGYHIDTPIKPLPENLKKIMDEAKNGVIYFSMGSVLKSKHMPNQLTNDFIKMFSELKQTVIWKFEEVLPNLPKNVHIIKWAPQPSILNHSNCILFITHGGLLSTTEAVHSGVPIIGIPMFADQFFNIKNAEKLGIAKQVDLTMNTPIYLKKAINEILTKDRYKTTIQHISTLYHDRPRSPGDELVYWVEHVVRTRGADHLRSPARLLPWYQKMYLDLIVLMFCVVSVLYFLAKNIYAFVARHLKSQGNEKKYN